MGYFNIERTELKSKKILTKKKSYNNKNLMMVNKLNFDSFKNNQ